MTKIAFLFPGQGAQSVGMAAKVVKEVTAAAKLFEVASQILGYDLLKICVQGPAEKLNSTIFSQPALFVAGLAAVEKLRREEPEVIAACQAAAGLSLGEYTALVFAEAMSFEEGLGVVKIRGQSMQDAADTTPSGMVSVIGCEPQKVAELCKKASRVGRVWTANFLCPGNIAVSGELAACEEIERLAPEFGAQKTVRLAVAGAFHTQIMTPADQKLSDALDSVDLKPPRIPVISNVDAKPHSDPDQIKKILVRQVLEPVQWESSMRYLLAEGFDKFYELGPGRVLAANMKRISRRTDFTNVTV